MYLPCLSIYLSIYLLSFLFPDSVPPPSIASFPFSNMNIDKIKVPYTNGTEQLYRFTYSPPVGTSKEFFITVEDYRKMGRGLTYETRIFNNIKFDVKSLDDAGGGGAPPINVRVNPIELFMKQEKDS